MPGPHTHTKAPTAHERERRTEYDRIELARHTSEHIYEQIHEPLGFTARQGEIQAHIQEHIDGHVEGIELNQLALHAPARVEQLEVEGRFDDPDPEVTHICRNSPLALLGVTFLGGLATGIVLFVMSQLEAEEQEDPDEPDPDEEPEPFADIPPEFKARVEELRKNWNALDDRAAWAALISFVRGVDGEAPSFYRQRYVVWVLRMASNGPLPSDAVLASAQRQLHDRWRETEDAIAVYQLAYGLEVDGKPLGRKGSLAALYAFLTDEFFSESTESSGS